MEAARNVPSASPKYTVMDGETIDAYSRDGTGGAASAHAYAAVPPPSSGMMWLPAPPMSKGTPIDAVSGHDAHMHTGMALHPMSDGTTPTPYPLCQTEVAVLKISGSSGQTEAHASRTGGLIMHTSSHNTNVRSADRSDTACDLSVATEPSPKQGGTEDVAPSSGASVSMHGINISHISNRSNRSSTYNPPDSAVLRTSSGKTPNRHSNALTQHSARDSERFMPGEIRDAEKCASGKSSLSVPRSGAAPSDETSSASTKVNVRALQTTVHNAVADMQNDLNDEALRVYDVLGQGGFGTVYHGAFSTVLNARHCSECMRCLIFVYLCSLQ